MNNRGSSFTLGQQHNPNTHMTQPTTFIGIDIAAESFTASVSIPSRSVLTTYDLFSNTGEGCEAFIAWLLSLAVTAQHSVVCMEATGVYSERLSYFLHHNGWRVTVEAPNKVKRAFPTAGSKNDALDSQHIAEYAQRFCDELKPWKPNDTIIEEVKVLLTAREQFTTQKTATINALKAVRYKVVDTTQVQTLYQTIIFQLKEQIKAIDKELKRLFRDHPSIGQMVAMVASAPSVGMLLASHLAVLTNGFTRSLDYRQLASYAGICPHEHTSGTSVHRRPRSAGFGPPRLRKLLYLASLSLRTHNKDFKHYFFRKVAEGKSKKLVLNNIANKLLKILCAMINSRQPYIKNFKSVNPKLLLGS